MSPIFFIFTSWHHHCTTQKNLTSMRRIILLSLLLFSLQDNVLAQEQDSLQHTLSIPQVEISTPRLNGDRRITPLTISTIDRQQIESENRSSLLPTLSESVPGLFITARGTMGYGVSTGSSGGISVRGIGGSPTTGVMVLLDGQPQYMGLMGHPIADVLHSTLAQSVEVVRGPASTLYGSNAMGGVINVITRRNEQDGLHNNLRIGYGSYNTLESNLTSSLRKGRFHSTLTANYDRSDGHRPDMAFEQYGGMLRAGATLSEEWELGGSLNLTHFNASNPGTISAPIIDNDSRITRGASSISLRNDYATTEGNLTLFYNWGLHKINDGYSLGEQPLDYRFRSTDRAIGVAWYQSASLLDGNTTSVGIDFQHFGGRATNTYLDNRPSTELSDRQLHNIAAYINFRQTITPWLTLDAGIRFDENSAVGHEWVPKGGISIQLPRNAQLKAVAAKGFRFPTIREMYMFPSQNADLEPESLWSYELSFEQIIKNFRYGINIFFIDGENMIRTLPIDGRPKNVNTGLVENFGIEGELSWQITSHWAMAANYSYLDMRHPVIAAPKHKLNGSIAYTSARWSISTSMQLVRGLYTQLSPLTTSNYLLWNCNAEYDVMDNFSLYLRGENLLAQRYEINAGYPMPRSTISVGVKLTL